MYLCIYVSMYLCMLCMLCMLCIYVCYVSMYLCIYVSMYLCIYVSMYLCIYVCYVCYVCYVSMYLCIYVSMYLCVYVSMYLCIYVCMYACMHACLCLYIYIHTTYVYKFMSYIQHMTSPKHRWMRFQRDVSEISNFCPIKRARRLWIRAARGLTRPSQGMAMSNVPYHSNLMGPPGGSRF